MKRSIKDLFSNFSFGQIVTVQGWLRSCRNSKIGISFLTLNDGSCFQSIQIVVNKTLINYSDEILNLTKDCSIEVVGELVESLGSKQTIEIRAKKVTVFGWVENPGSYPISAKNHTVEYLREHAHLRVRTNLISSVARVRHSVFNAIHNYFNDKNFFWINTPIITSNDCEGSGKLFRVSTLDYLNFSRTEKGDVDYGEDFFGKKVFLTVSGQLNAETYCMGLSKVYTFGPSFRAEKSNTSRHLAEFWMIEPEIAFSGLDSIVSLAEDLLKFVISSVLEKRSDEMNFFNQFSKRDLLKDLDFIICNKFVCIEYTDAICILKKISDRFKFPVNWGLDLQLEHERFLCEEYFKSPVILINYPKNIKAFYMRLNDDKKTVAAMDVLVPRIGEIIGGSQREERFNILNQRIFEKEGNIEKLYWYRDLRRYGTVPHSGFGLGFERLLSCITGISNVRDLIPFPRIPANAKF